MNLHEYQAKALFEEYDLPVSRRGIISEKDQIQEALESIMDCDQAASIIQCNFRGFLARKATETAKRVNDRQDWTN